MNRGRAGSTAGPAHTLPVRRPATIGLLATAIVVGFPVTGAFAASDAATGTASYAVELVVTSTGPDGDEQTETEAGTLVVSCTATDCRVIDGPQIGPLARVQFSTGASLAAASDDPGASTACDGGGGPTRMTFTADAAAFSGTMTRAPLGWSDCADGGQAYSYAQQVTWTGDLVSTDPCVFTAAGCVAAPAALPPRGSGVSRIADGDPAAPSVLSALVTPATVGSAPVQLGLAAALAVVLVLLMTFPTSLLNSAVDAGTDRWAQWRSSRRAARAAGADGSADADSGPDAEPPPRRPTSKGRATAIGAVAAAGLLSAFIDPGFGFNPGSVRVLISLLVGLALEVVVGWLVVIWIVRRTLPGTTHRFTAKPLTLLVVLATVVFTRLTGFEPGIVFGLVAGVSFALITRTAKTEARLALIPLGHAFVLGLLAWAGYGLLGGPAASGDSVVLTFVADTLASLVVGGMVALPLALVPVRGFTGHAVWSWNRFVWAGCYALGLFAFFVVLMPMPFSWGEVPFALATWVCLYFAYALVAVIAWLVLVRPWRRQAASAVTETTPTPTPTAADAAALDIVVTRD